MKTLKTITYLCFLFFSCTLFAQENYSVNGETYSLKTEVSGTLTLLWNTIDKEYRYFAKKGDVITELKNTAVGRKFQEEYKESLVVLTNDAPVAVTRVKLTLVSLRTFFNEYNKKVDPSYVVNSESIALQTRLGIFGGVSNHIFTSNPENELTPVVGIEFEVFDEKMLPSHAIVFQFRQSFKSDEFRYSSTQFALNYRFKFIKSEAVSVYVNTKLITYTYSEREIDTTLNPTLSSKLSGGALQAPIIFGLGADIKLGNGFVMLGYNDALGLTIDDNGEFPLDFTLGYKLNL